MHRICRINLILITLLIAGGGLSVFPSSAVAQSAGPAQVSQIETGSELVYSVALDPTGPQPDGTRLVAVAACHSVSDDGLACQDYELGLWDLTTGQRAGEPLTSPQVAEALVRFHPSGKLLATLSVGSNVIRLWTVNDDYTLTPAGPDLETDTDMLLDVTFSPDGTRLATSAHKDEYGVVQLWDVATHQRLPVEIQPELGHTGGVRFSPDSSVLAIGHCVEYASAKSFALETFGYSPADEEGWEMVKGFGDFMNPRELMGFAGCTRGAVVLVDVATGALVGTPLIGGDGMSDMLAMSSDGRYLANTNFMHNSITVWDLTTYQPVAAPLFGHYNMVTTLAFAADDRFLISTSTDGTALAWDLAQLRDTGTPAAYKMELPGVGIADGSVVPGESLLVVGGWEGRIMAWDVPSDLPPAPALPTNPVLIESQVIEDMIALPDGRIVTVPELGAVGVWDISGAVPVGFHFSPGFEFISAFVAVHPDGHTLAFGRDTGLVIFWDLDTGTALPKGLYATEEDVLYEGDSQTSIRSIEFSPDGRWLATGHRSGTILLWDLAAGLQPAGYAFKLEGHTLGALSLAFSPDSQILASVGADMTVRLWDMAAIAEGIDTGKLPWEIESELAVWEGHTNEVYSVTFSPDGTRLATSSADGTITLWDTATGENVWWPAPDVVYSLAFSPDGTQLASAGFGGDVLLWDVNNPPPASEPILLGNHRDVARVVVFTPNGDRVVSGGLGELGVWTVR